MSLKPREHPLQIGSATGAIELGVRDVTAAMHLHVMAAGRDRMQEVLTAWAPPRRPERVRRARGASNRDPDRRRTSARTAGKRYDSGIRAAGDGASRSDLSLPTTTKRRVPRNLSDLYVRTTDPELDSDLE